MAKKRKDKELEDVKNQLKRALADYSNLQRRVEEDKKILVKFANARLLVKLLDILDILESVQKTLKDEGLHLSIKKFKEVLLSEGVQETNSQGKDFDPNLHEAVEVVSGDKNDKVVEVLTKGYSFEDKILRPARVKVSKK